MECGLTTPGLSMASEMSEPQANGMMIRSMHDLMLANIGELENLYVAHGPVDAPSGLHDEGRNREIAGFDGFDRLTGGLRKKSLIILEGMQGSGMTTLALNIAAYYALFRESVHECRGQAGAPVSIFSTDLPAERLSMRLLSAQSGVPMDRLRAGNLDATDWRLLASAFGALEQSAIHIAHRPAMSIDAVRSACLGLKKENGGPGLIIIDSLAKAAACSDKPSRKREFRAVAEALKTLAVEQDAPVLALAEVESANATLPLASFMTCSQALATEADTILLLHRKGAFAELEIASPCGSPPDRISLLFSENRFRFESS